MGARMPTNAPGSISRAWAVRETQAGQLPKELTISQMPFPPTPSGESSFHSGNCHCGAVRFNFTLSPPLHEYPTNSCNCSICTRNGYLLVYPFNKDFVIEKGDTLKDYLFAGHRSKHQFCGVCGSSCFIRILEEGAPPISAVNVRLLQDIDLEKLHLNQVDGRSVGPAYTL